MGYIHFTALAYGLQNTMKPREQQRQNLITLIGVVVIIVILGAGALIALSGGTKPNTPIDYSKLTQSRAADGGFVLGNPDAKATLVEFSDFRCPHCQEYQADIHNFLQEYVVPGKAKYEYRFFMTVDATTNGYASRLVECADTLKPNSFFLGVETMFGLTASSQLDDQQLARSFADKMGVQYGDLLQCVPSTKQVDVDYKYGTNLGVQGTPAVMMRTGDSITWVDSNRGAVDYSTLKARFDRVLSS